jgi:hypothetical protein
MCNYLQYVHMQLNNFGNADATSCPLVPCGGREAKLYAGRQEVRIHVWGQRRQAQFGYNADADPPNGAELIAAFPSRICSRSLGQPNLLAM